jgi:hypothetical protein
MSRSDEWSDFELQQLARLKDENLTYAEIGEKIGRSAKACSVKWKRIRADGLIPDVESSRPKFVEHYDWPEDVDWREWVDLWGDTLEREKKIDPINTKLTVNLSHLTDPINICFAGDLHMGGGFTNHKLIRDTIEFILETPNTYLALVGDVIEGFLPSFRSAEAREQMPASVKSQIAAYRSLVNELLSENCLLWATWGDHDGMWMEKAIGINVVKNTIHDRVPYFTGRGLVKVLLGGQTYHIIANHRENNRSQWNRVHPSRRQFDRFFPADIMVTAHTHQPSFQMDYQLVDAREAGLGIGGKVWYVVTGTAKTGPDPYTIRGWNPGVFGVPTATLFPDKRDIEFHSSPTYAHCFTTGYHALADTVDQ